MAGRPKTLSEQFEPHAKQWGEIAERRRERVQRAEALERGGLVIMGGPNLPKWMKYTLVPLAAVGGLTMSALAAYGVYQGRQEAEVQNALSVTCGLSPEIGNIATGSCINTVTSRIPLTNQAQTELIEGVVNNVSDAGDTYVKGIKPEGSGALFVTWEAVPNDAYANTYQSTITPAEAVTISGLIDGLADSYIVTGNQDLYNACMADNAARVQTVRANATEYAQGTSFTAEMIQDPTIVLDPHQFAPYVDGQGKLLPALPSSAHRQILNQDSAGNVLMCPVPKG